MSNIGVNTFVKLDFTFYKKKLIGKVMKTNILGYLNGNSSYIYVVIYVHECNFNTYTYFTPFVQGYNLRGDRNKLCIFLLARGLIYLLKLIFFSLIENSSVSTRLLKVDQMYRPNIIFSSLNKKKTF